MLGTLEVASGDPLDPDVQMNNGRAALCFKSRDVKFSASKSKASDDADHSLYWPCGLLLHRQLPATSGICVTGVRSNQPRSLGSKGGPTTFETVLVMQVGIL